MPLLTKVFTITAGVLSIPMFGSSIIAANYPSPILHSLVDVINGNNSATVASLNAPNWSEGAPLAQAIANTAATSSHGSAASGLASSTAYYFEIAALDGSGTTSVSNIISATTDASNTQPTPEDINVSWGSVTGATGYAVYFSTTTQNNFTQYFLATSTAGVPNTTYDFSTSSASIAGSYTRQHTTAFSYKINPIGSSYFNGGNVGIGTSTPGSLLSLGGIANFTTGTSTFYSTGGLVLTGGCLTYTVSGPCITSGASVSSANTWSSLQQYSNASTSKFSCYGPCYFGATATSSFGMNGAITLATPLTAGNGGTGTTTFLTGSIPFFNGTYFTENNPSLFWDNTNFRLAIGSTTPAANLQVAVSAANSTTTVEFGKAGQNKGTCIKLYTANGTAVYAYATTTSGPLYLTATACASVASF